MSLRVGDVVNWDKDAEVHIISVCKGFTLEHPGPFVITAEDVRVKISTLEGEPVTREAYEYETTTGKDWWWDGFFVVNPFLTKVHKAINRKRKHATLELPIR